MGLINQSICVEPNNPLNKEHIGIVTDINDPLNLCRVKVVIPGILDVDNEVWFTREISNFPGVAYNTPRLGQRIRVWFRDGNINKGVYGFDYVHEVTQLKLFEPGDYGFADLNFNLFRVRGRSTTIKTGSINLEGNLNVSGNVSAGNGYTGSFSAGDGSIVTVEDGIITGITSAS